jgi:ABC-type metal ion transport system substrate-binding protein
LATKAKNELDGQVKHLLLALDSEQVAQVVSQAAHGAEEVLK